MTLSPAANFWKPSTTTLSPAFRPSVTNQLAVLHRAGAHRLHGDAVVVLDDEHLAAAAAVALDRLLRHRDGVAVDALLDPDADIHARQQFALRIAEIRRASVTWPVWASTLASENSSLPCERIERAVVEHEAHLGGIGRDALEVAALEGAAQLIELGHRLGEVGIDRIELLDGREACVSFCTDERAFADQRRADDAVDRRADGGVIEIELGARDVGLAALDVGLRPGARRRSPFRSRLRARRVWLVSVAMRRACCVACIERGLGLGERRLVRLHLDLERPRIDPVERIAGLDLAALIEQALDHDAGDARPHLGDARRRDAARQFAHHRARLRLDGDDADVGLGGLRGGGRGSWIRRSPASSGASAASINAMHADRARSPDMKWSRPD